MINPKAQKYNKKWFASLLKYNTESINKIRRNVQESGINNWNGYFIDPHSNSLHFWGDNDTILEVVNESDVDDLLKLIYEDPSIGMRGRDKLYDKIKEEYLGVSKNRIQTFLNKQEAYQRSVRPRKIVIVKPLRVSAPFKHWQADLTDFQGISTRQGNANNTFMLVVVDVFSKFVYLEPLKRKRINPLPGEIIPTAEEEYGMPERGNYDPSPVIAAFKKIFDERTFEVPERLQTDRGSEFISKRFKVLMREKGIKHILSDAYKPTTQGAVERVNQTIKKILRTHFVMNSTKNWVGVIEDVEKNINESIHTVTGMKPKDLNYLGYQHPEDPIINQVKEKLNRVADERLKKRGLCSFEEVQVKFPIGTKVRLRYETRLQKGLLERDEKNRSKSELTPYWSKEIYTIKKIYRDGRVELIELPNKTFFCNDIIKVPEGTVKPQQTLNYKKYHPLEGTERTIEQNIPPVVSALEERSKGPRREAMRRATYYREPEIPQIQRELQEHPPEPPVQFSFYNFRRQWGWIYYWALCGYSFKLPTYLGSCWG